MAALISSLLDPSRIILDLQNVKRTAALHELAETLRGNGNITDFDGFYQELLARDRLDTTSLGNGIALPHARTEHVKAIVMVVGRSSRGILFEHGNETVHLMFMLGTPKSKPGDYLQVLGALCRILKDAGVRELLQRAPTPQAFMEIIAAAELKLQPGAKC
jgi:mannitol/fructose-specific phosphotransferase system IIA component (Ntr-type)